MSQKPRKLIQIRDASSIITHSSPNSSSILIIPKRSKKSPAKPQSRFLKKKLHAAPSIKPSNIITSTTIPLISLHSAGLTVFPTELARIVHPDDTHSTNLIRLRNRTRVKKQQPLAALNRNSTTPLTPHTNPLAINSNPLAQLKTLNLLIKKKPVLTHHSHNFATSTPQRQNGPQFSLLNRITILPQSTINNGPFTQHLNSFASNSKKGNKKSKPASTSNQSNPRKKSNPSKSHRSQFDDTNDFFDDNHGVNSELSSTGLDNKISTSSKFDLLDGMEDPVENLTPTIISSLDNIFAAMISQHQSTIHDVFKHHYPQLHQNNDSNNGNNNRQDQQNNSQSTHTKNPKDQRHQDQDDSTTLHTPTEDGYDFAGMFSHVYPVQHLPINEKTPIVILSTITFQQYISSTFALIDQYKQYLADPDNNPLPSTLHDMVNKDNTGISLKHSTQVCTPRSLAIATFTNYPVVTFENIGISSEALAYACGFSHEHIPVAYKCLGAVRKQKFRDDVGAHIRHALKKGLPSSHAGTTGKATTDDLDRWISQVGSLTAEIMRENEIKARNVDGENGDNGENGQFVGKYTGDLMDNNNPNDVKTKHNDHNEVDPLDNEARLLTNRDSLEQKQHEKIIRSMISQRLHDLGVKVVVMVDDAVDTRHENFFKLIHSYLLHSFQSLDVGLDLRNIDTSEGHLFTPLQDFTTASDKNAKLTPIKAQSDLEDAYSFSGDSLHQKDKIPPNTQLVASEANPVGGITLQADNTDSPHSSLLTKLNQTQLRIAIKKLYIHFLHSTLPNNYHFDENGNFKPDLTTHSPDNTRSKYSNLGHLDEDFNPQYTQSFFEWLMGFGMHPAQFQQHAKSLLPLLLDQTLSQTTLPQKPSTQLGQQQIQGLGHSGAVSIIPDQFRGDLVAYINSTVDMIKGLHLNEIDGVLYGDLVQNSKLGGIYSLLLKNHLLSKKQERKDRQFRHRHDAAELRKKNREIMKLKLGGDDRDGWNDEGQEIGDNGDSFEESGNYSGDDSNQDSNDDAGSDDGSDDDDNDDNDDDEKDSDSNDEDEMNTHFQKQAKGTQQTIFTGKNGGRRASRIQEGLIDAHNSTKQPSPPPTDPVIAEIQSKTFDELILTNHPPSTIVQNHPQSSQPPTPLRNHIDISTATQLTYRIHRKENVIFGPLIGVDFVNGVARTKRLRGSFDQRSPLIQAVLGSRNATKATPNTRNPLLPVNEGYAINKFQAEHQEALIQNDLANLSAQPKANTLRELIEASQADKSDKLLPFWEQLDLEQSQFDQDLSSYVGKNGQAGPLTTQSQHLLSHYEAIDKHTPLGEIVPVGTLQQRQIDQQEEKRMSQLRHLKTQQEAKEVRQREWLEIVQKHVLSGSANVVEDDLGIGFDQEHTQQPNHQAIPLVGHHNTPLIVPETGFASAINSTPTSSPTPTHLTTMRSVPLHLTSLSQHFTTNTTTIKSVLLPLDPSLPPLPANGVILPSERKKYLQDSVNISFHVRSDTVTTLYRQQRIYNENSAYIIRYYRHATTTIKTPDTSTLDFATLNLLPMEDTTAQTTVNRTESTTVSRLLRVCDVTGGFGTDSFILASSVNQNKDLELEINMVEGDKILYTLLADGIRRAQQVHRYDGITIPEFKVRKVPGHGSYGSVSEQHGSKKSQDGRDNTFRQSNHQNAALYSGSRLGLTLFGKSMLSGGQSGFKMENMYGDDDSDNDSQRIGPGQSISRHHNDGDDSDDFQHNVRDYEQDSYLNANNSPQEQADVIQSLKRERYFPHSKVTLPKIHGMDLSDPAVQRKLNKKGQYGSSQQDLHFEQMMKEQQRIVELAEKTLKDYIEGGLGEDTKAKSNTNADEAKDGVAMLNGVPLQVGQAFSSANPLLRNKMLAQQHLSEVSLIARRMSVVYGNSLEYLTRTHFRVPAHITVPPQQQMMVGRVTDLTTIMNRVQKKLKENGLSLAGITPPPLLVKQTGVQTADGNEKTLPANNVFVEGEVIITRKQKVVHHFEDNGDVDPSSIEDISSSESTNSDQSNDYDNDDNNNDDNSSDDSESDDGGNSSENNPNHYDKKFNNNRKSKRNASTTITTTISTPTHSVSLRNMKIFDSNPHASPVFSPHYPYPTHASNTKESSYRPWDVIYMDPFYPVKNKGKRAKHKMLQRNSKFMSFAKSLQEVYQQQEIGLSVSRKHTDAVLARLIDFAVEKQEMAQMEQFGNQLGVLPQSPQFNNTNAKSNNLPSQRGPIPGDSDQLILNSTSGSLEDIVVNFQHISSKLALLHQVSQDSDLIYHTRTVNSDIDPSMTKPRVELAHLRQYQEKVMPVLTTNDQFSIYSTLTHTIQGLLGQLYESTNLLQSQSRFTFGNVAQQQGTSRIKAQTKLAKQLCQIYISLYSVSPQLLPLYVNAMLTASQPLKPTVNIDPGSHSEQLPNNPIFLLPTTSQNRAPTNSIGTTNSLILTREPENTHLLFDAARITANRRVVLKRPIYAPILHKSQTVSLVDNKTRFDVITPLTSKNFTNRVLWSILGRARERYNANYQYQSAERSLTHEWEIEQHAKAQLNEPSGYQGSNTTQSQSILSYDSSIPQPMYNTKLQKRQAKIANNNLNTQPQVIYGQHTTLRAPHQPYLAFTTFSSSGNDVNDTSGISNDTNSMLQSVNRQKQIKLDKKRAEERMRAQIRKEKRKNKRK